MYVYVCDQPQVDGKQQVKSHNQNGNMIEHSMFYLLQEDMSDLTGVESNMC